MKSLGSTEESLAILPGLGVGEEGGTHRVAVECVDTVRYPDGEGNPLALPTLKRESVGSKGD